MRRAIFFAVVLAFFSGGELIADETVRAAQQRLKETGFYFGEVTGTYDDATAAAVSRYQIRHGLQISGELNEPTLKSLGASEADATAGQGTKAGDAWRHLRKSDREFLKKLDHGEVPPPQTGAEAEGRAAEPPPPAEGPPAMTPAATPPRSPAPPGAVTPAAAAPPPDLSGPPPNAVEQAESPPEMRAQDRSAMRSDPQAPLSTVPPPLRERETDYAIGKERLRDYVGAFVLAGLAPEVASEVEFFADRVGYFDQGTLDHDQIRRDLRNYNRRWPERRFWLAGDLDVDRLENGRLRVSFPLRYELQSNSDRASGKVRKTIVLEPVGDDFEIVAVNERKLR